MRARHDASSSLLESVFAGLKKTMVEETAEAKHASDKGSLLAGALSQALCFTSAMLKNEKKMSARILVVQTSPDTPSQYVSIMNAIFSAEKQAMPVDTCMLCAEDSVYMQQAASRTQGLYVKLPIAPPAQEKSDLFQQLFMVFLPCPKTRALLVLPQQAKVDLRATCFCHHKSVSQASVCPVCLAIYCVPKTQCESCGTRFPIQSTAMRRTTASTRPSTVTT